MPVADLKHDDYPRSSSYDADWLLARDMGPNPLWLLEDLARDLVLRPGMRVLDLGSGKGATSVFLAKEYGVQVWAADLWVEPTDAAAHIDRDDVVTLKAEAHTLPVAPPTSSTTDAGGSQRRSNSWVRRNSSRPCPRTTSRSSSTYRSR